LPDVSDFIPVVRENIDTIRARMDADVNAGLDPADPRWTDTVEGGPFFDLSQVVALEIERLYDTLGTEIPAAMFVSFAWGDYTDEHALTYGLVRKDATKATGVVRFTGPATTPIETGVQVGTEPADPDAEGIVFQTTQSGVIPVGGYIDLTVEAMEAGAGSNIAVGQASLLLSAVSGIASVANLAAISGGEEQESDEALRDRTLLEIASAQGAGTAADYVRWSLAYPGVGHVTVQSPGAGAVTVIVTDAANQPVAAGVVTGLQALLDPVGTPGAGQGLAPIGAVVTVSTPTYYYVNVQATIVHDTGYTLTGAAGTIATSAAITAAITAYVNGLAPGAEVVLNRIEFEALGVRGVHDVTGTQLAGWNKLAAAWAAGTAYAVDDAVTYLGLYYRRLIAGTTAGTPLADTTNWSPVADRAMGATNLPVAAAKIARVQAVTLT
jgi:uncharacterized phage protein gp47/JayE